MNRILATSLCALVASALPVVAVDEQKLVWAHYTPWHTPLNASISAYNYYNYPLFRSEGTDRADWAEEFRQAQAQGIDGFMVDVVFKKEGAPAYADFVRKMLQAAEGGDFKIALCLDVKTDVPTQVRELSKMLNDFGKHPNYPRVDDRPVVATYTWLRWTPQEWKDIIEGLGKEGHNPYFVANVDPGYGRLTQQQLEEYMPHMDMAYSFSMIGINGLPRQMMADEIADAMTSEGKAFMATLYPGYWGAWLNGRNDFYQPHRGFDLLHDTFMTVHPERDQWLHLTTWNDHDETSILPMLFTTANPRITKAYSDAFKGIAATGAEPDISFSYHREEVAGTLLRIEALSLPTAVDTGATVSGQLLDRAGREVAVLEPRTLATNDFARTEWLVPTAELAATPTLTPRITVRSGNYVRTVTLPPVLLVNGWQQNAVTVKVPVNEIVGIESRLDVARNPASANRLDVRAGYDVGRASHGDATAPEDTVRSITLFRNDRPLAVFNDTTEGRTLLNLRVNATEDWNLKIEDGEILNALRRFTEQGSTAFVWNTHSVTSSRMQGWLFAALLCEVGERTRFTLRTGGAEPFTFTLGELLKSGSVQAGRVTVEVVSLDATVQSHVLLSEVRGERSLSVQLAEAPALSDMFFLRYETHGGYIAFSPVVYPFAEQGATLAANLIQTPTSMEAASGASGMPGESEYLTADNRLPFTTDTLVRAQIAPESVRIGQWLFDEGGRAARGEMHVANVPPSMLVSDSQRLGQVLKLDGTSPLKMRLRTWPIGNATVDFFLKPAAGAQKPQSVIGRTGWSDAVNISLLPDGRIEVVRDGSNTVPSEKLISKAAIPFDAWSRVRVVNDSGALRIYIDGKLDAERTLTPARSYGNSTWFVGGGFEAGIKAGYANYTGLIDDLTVIGAAVDASELLDTFTAQKP